MIVYIIAMDSPWTQVGAHLYANLDRRPSNDRFGAVYFRCPQGAEMHWPSGGLLSLTQTETFGI